ARRRSFSITIGLIAAWRKPLILTATAGQACESPGFFRRATARCAESVFVVRCGETHLCASHAVEPSAGDCNGSQDENRHHLEKRLPMGREGGEDRALLACDWP